MRPGMRFQGSVELARARNVMLIPRNAVFMTQNGPVAYRRGLFAVDTIPLELGRENDQSVEVQSGLAAGDRVLVEKKKDQSATLQWKIGVPVSPSRKRVIPSDSRRSLGMTPTIAAERATSLTRIDEMRS